VPHLQAAQRQDHNGCCAGLKRLTKLPLKRRARRLRSGADRTAHRRDRRARRHHHPSRVRFSPTGRQHRGCPRTPAEIHDQSHQLSARRAVRFDDLQQHRSDSASAASMPGWCPSSPIPRAMPRCSAGPRISSAGPERLLCPGDGGLLLFGKQARACADDLLRRGLTHFVASDARDGKFRTPNLHEAYARLAEE
jgi:hypothetical protein